MEFNSAGSCSVYRSRKGGTFITIVVKGAETYPLALLAFASLSALTNHSLHLPAMSVWALPVFFNFLA
jgi:hypothetical protein